MHLPVERVAASSQRIELLARAARRAGDTRPIDHIRTDLFLGMTEGTYEGLKADQILATLLAAHGGEAANAGEPAPTTEPTPRSEPVPTPEPSWAGVQLQVRLTTLLGLDRYPGELAGWGTCHADLATAIAPDLVRAWDPVLAELADKLTDPTTVRPLDPRRRAPGAALRREVTTAITTCIGAGCRAPASTGDLDHLQDHAKGGDTVEDNLDPLCRHDHRVKTEAGWALRRVEDTFEWTTRLGHVYLVPIQPVLPNLPGPQPRPGPGSDPYPLLRRPPTHWDETQHGPPPF